MNPFRLQHAALAPWCEDPGREALAEVLARDGEPAFLAWVLEQGLGPLWAAALRREPDLWPLSAQTRAALDQARRESAVSALLQGHTLGRAGAALDAAGIPYAVFKGAGLRGLLYAEPGLRPADDVDVLVQPSHRDPAVSALTRAGFRLVTKGANLSHEADLIRDGVQVDLHWQLMRPGRSRGELATPLLRHRQCRTGIWCLDPSAALLAGLVQPAITKQISGPWSKLIRLLDLDLLIRHPEPDWDWVLETIMGAGLGPAAWTTLYWLQCLLHTPVPVQVLDRLAPGPLRRAYLRQWIDRELPTRLSPIPFLVQGAFTLALHQGPRDVARAVAGLARAHIEAPRIRRRVEQAATV